MRLSMSRLNFLSALGPGEEGGEELGESGEEVSLPFT